MFFFRDHSGAEIDFVVVSPQGLTFIEAKHSERIRPERLSFEKVEPRIPTPILKRRVAAPTGMQQTLPMDGYEIYDPRFGE